MRVDRKAAQSVGGFQGVKSACVCVCVCACVRTTSISPLPFRFLMVFMRKFVDWSIISTFWKRYHAALFINSSKQYIAESALFKEKKGKI